MDSQLLHMDYSIRLNDLIDECTHLMLIHGPDLIEPVFIRLLKTLEFVLQFLELLGEFFVVVSELDVFFLEVF